MKRNIRPDDPPFLLDVPLCRECGFYHAADLACDAEPAMPWWRPEYGRHRTNGD